MHQFSVEDGSAYLVDKRKKYWMIVPNVGQPIMISPQSSEEGILELAKSEIKDDASATVSYRLLRHEGLIVKSKPGVRVDTPSIRTLFDLGVGDEIKTIRKQTIDGEVTPSKTYKVSALYWVRINEKLGYINVGADKECLRLSPDGRDESGHLAVTF